MDIQVRINHEGALRNQRFAFTDRFTLVTELLQNARRAGATLIEIIHDVQSKTLSIQDNGCGIDDFQKLLTFNETGWNEATQQDESPFGIGFSKCLYAAGRCIVASRGRFVDIDTTAALAQAPIPVQDADPDKSSQPGTAIALFEVELEGLAHRMPDLCRGFPVAVTFNGQEIARPHALPGLKTQATSVGHIHIAGMDDGKFTRYTVVYLQGFRVHQAPTYYSCDDLANVVHLDPTRFVARLPDREKLIDEEEQIKLVDKAISVLWLNALQEKKAALPAQQFVEAYFDAAKHWRHTQVFDDVDCLPMSICEAIGGYPRQAPFGQLDFLEAVKQPISRDEVLSGEVTLASIDYPDSSTAPCWMFAKAKGYVVIKTTSLSDGHWVHGHVRHLDANEVVVEPVDLQRQASFEGRWVDAEVLLCAHVRIRIKDDVAEIHEDGFSHEDAIYVPAKESTGIAVEQASSFMDSKDRYHEDDRDADAEALADLIRLLRAVDPMETLQGMLTDLKLEKYPVLHGRTFRLTISQQHQTHVLELIE